MATRSTYSEKLKLKLKTAKLLPAFFHLNNKEASRELNVTADGRTIPFSVQPTYRVSKALEVTDPKTHITS